MMDKQVPVKAIMLVRPDIGHAVIVPNDSRYRALVDLKGTGTVIGIVTAPSADSLLVSALKAHGLEPGKGVFLRSMPTLEEALLAKGVAATVLWDFTATQLIQLKKTGRAIGFRRCSATARGSTSASALATATSKSSWPHAGSCWPARLRPVGVASLGKHAPMRCAAGVPGWGTSGISTKRV
jgi:NMT1/THI5 like